MENRGIRGARLIVPVDERSVNDYRDNPIMACSAASFYPAYNYAKLGRPTESPNGIFLFRADRVLNNAFISRASPEPAFFSPPQAIFIPRSGRTEKAIEKTGFSTSEIKYQVS